LDQALGNPSFLIWTPIKVKGESVSKLDKWTFNWWWLSKDVWEPINHEHILFFETDSMIIRNDGCVEKFLTYDYVGAPWPYGEGGNGGLSLHRRSSAMPAILSDDASRMMTSEGAYRDLLLADVAMVQLLQGVHSFIAPREEEQRFSVEIIDHPAPCGFHKRWLARCDSETDVADVMRGYMFQAQQAML